MDKKPLKIAFMSFYKGHFERGAENWVDELASRLSENNVVTVFQSGEVKPNKYKVNRINVSIDWNKPDSRKFFIRRFFLDYWSLKVAEFVSRSLIALWKGKYDVVISIGGGWEPAILRILCWLRSAKLVIVGQAGIGWDDKNNLYCFPDCFVALSEKASKWAKKWNPLVRVEKIHNAVDTTKFTPKGEKVEIKLKRPIVLAVGALEEGKRFKLVIDAVSKTNANLLILGKGVMKEKLINYGNKKLKNRFLLKEVQFSEIPKYYRSCDIFTSASGSWYSFEMVIVEAMASGLPVVVTDDQIRREIVGNAGYFVDPENIVKYSEKLEKAVESKAKIKMVERARLYDWGGISNKYELLFKNLCKIK